MAKAFAHPGPAGFCIPEGEGGGVCGRLFLAFLPEALHEAQEQSFILGDEVNGEQGARPACEPDPAKGRLDGRPHLGTRVGAEAFAESHAQTAVGWFGRLLNHEKHERHEKGKDLVRDFEFWIRNVESGRAPCRPG